MKNLIRLDYIIDQIINTYILRDIIASCKQNLIIFKFKQMFVYSIRTAIEINFISLTNMSNLFNK